MRDSAEPSDEFEAFLYRVTHDMKGYTRAIRVLPDWVFEDLSETDIELPESVTENLQMLRTYAQGMDRMLEGLTELSRVGRLADTPAQHELHTLLQEAWKPLSEHNAFVLKIDGEPAQITGPENELVKLFAVIFSNAILHHDGKDGTVCVTARQLDDRLRVRIEDDGPGIEPQYRAQVFEPLTTLQPKEERGTAGLGLAIAQKIVRNLAGDILLVEPENAQGCAVEIDLPV